VKSEEFAPAFGQWFQKQAGAPVAVGIAIRSDGSLNCFNPVVNTT
jgi:predicted phosphoadenosine phosphosulfate sulfurtransferase